MLLLPLLVACKPSAPRNDSSVSLADARRGFHSTLLPRRNENEPVEPAPPEVFRVVRYPAPAGGSAAYLTPDPKDGKKHPAILWITGGDCNSIGDVWSPAPRDNDQTAAAYRHAGIVMMFASLRGGNDNPGAKEGFLGEVDDVLAAAKYLEEQSFVDANRIYLGGHSTGGTLALLVAECSPRFRSVLSFGPVGDVSEYGTDSGFLPFDLTKRKEVELRSPLHWLSSIRSPVWVLEGTKGNIEPLRDMAKEPANANVHFVEIRGSGHFATLAPTNELIARKILEDTAERCNITLSPEEVNRNFAAHASRP